MKRFAPVSVVIPCYNSGSSISRAVESVYNQSLCPQEVILVDDCSSDNTLSVLYELQCRYPDGWIKVVSLQENKGAGSARNHGWDVAQQEYLAFLDSDDSWHTNKVEVQYHWMLKNPGADLTGHGCRQMGQQECLKEESRLTASEIPFKKLGRLTMLLFNRLPTPTVMLKRNLPFRFAEGGRYSEDYHLWLQISLSGYQCFHSTEKMAYLYKAPYGDDGLSANLWEMEKGELAGYRALYVDNKIGLLSFGGLVVWSILKFLRRVLL